MYKNIDQILKILKENEERQIQLIQHYYQNAQERLNVIGNNYNLQMGKITDELNIIKTQSQISGEQIENNLSILNRKIHSIYQNVYLYQNIQNVNYYMCCYYPNYTPDSEIGKIVLDGIKAILINLLKNNLSEQEKIELELCNDIIETFNSVSTLHNQNNSKRDKGIAIVKVAELLNKYFK